MTTLQSGRMAIHIATRPMLVAGRLRVLMEQRGFVALPPKTEPPPTGFSLALTKDGPGACWVVPDIVDAIPDELGHVLSQELQCRVTTVAEVGSIQAYEVVQQGQTVEKLAADGTKVLDARSSTYEPAVSGGQSLIDVLVASGLEGAALTFEAASTARRAMRLSFAPRRRADAEEIEIDPTLSCPLCGSAMRKNTGKYGVFWGCVRFPECRGRLTERQAEASRGQSS